MIAASMPPAGDMNEEPAERHPLSFTLRVTLSPHAAERITDRLSLSMEEVMAMINQGRTICLTNLFLNYSRRGKFIFYSAADNDFFIAIIGFSEVSDTGILITVLTREQYENDTGEKISFGYRSRAVASAVGRDEYNEWRTRDALSDLGAKNCNGNYKNIRLKIDYLDNDMNAATVILRSPPIGIDLFLSKPMRELLEIDTFSDWLLTRIRRKAIPADKIVTMHLLIGVGDIVELEA